MSDAIAIKSDGIEVAMATMTKDSLENIGRHTYRFVRRLMRNPVIRQKIMDKVAELEAVAQT